ncbi:thiopeptide-type bacteriocin biosynthesis protein [Marinifilum fragile]|uniref:thiopeptide-type bacteriocin biosynthesis protein n=1 Tax=Marinifilum fragile TaxID=570161 RepID=UPI002AA81A64|nr:thiopeptide-type bacteriocin biosynthesis protein [Marinifilum fragile]
MKEVQKISKRTFIIGDEWLYYKLYCGPKTSDEVLINAIKPLVDELIEHKIIDKWFFIRYADPKMHLRLRFRCSNQKSILTIITAVNTTLKTYVDDDLVWNIQIDSYKREIERYGENTIELSEELFFYDSKLIVDTINLIEGDEGETVRWLFSLRAIDNLLDDFKFDDQQKVILLQNLKDGFGREFGMNRLLKLQLDKKFRTERESINNVMNKEYDSQNKMKPLFELLKQKSSRISHISDEILFLAEKNMLQRPLNDLMGSYIHMLMNRLFKSKQRLHEMVIYDFLYRYYKSEIAKKMYEPKLQKIP